MFCFDYPIVKQCLCNGRVETLGFLLCQKKSDKLFAWVKKVTYLCNVKPIPL